MTDLMQTALRDVYLEFLAIGICDIDKRTTDSHIYEYVSLILVQ